MRKPRWTNESMALAWKVIHLQDILITGLGLCLDKIKLQKYKEFKDRYLPAVSYTAKLLEGTSRDLIKLRTGRTGRPAFWFEKGEDTLAFSLQTQRAIPLIQKEIRQNKWKKIESRLEECQQQCLNIQTEILNAMPEESKTEEPQISQRSVVDFLNIVATFEIGQTTGGAWKRTRK
jgi:hypothetical protein